MICGFLWMMKNENWKPVSIRGVRLPYYYVSDHGRVLSTKGGKERILKIRIREKSIAGRGGHSDISLAKPKDLILDDYRGDGKTFAGTYQIHQLVMWAFKPVDQNPPDELRDDWNSAPESFKQWVRDTVVIDHINDNPHDNRIDNLQYVTPKKNNAWRKLYLKENNDN